jgi:hypothetical protein
VRESKFGMVKELYPSFPIGGLLLVASLAKGDKPAEQEDVHLEAVAVKGGFVTPLAPL